MINLFGKKKVNIKSISFPTFGWVRQKGSQQIRNWYNPERSIGLSINFFDIEPDLPTIKNIEPLINTYRNGLKDIGAIIEVDIIQLKGYKVVKTIFKIPQEPMGMTYVGSFTIPFENCSFVIKVQAKEIGITGIRDNVILTQLMGVGEVNFGDDGLENWFYDPYDSEINEGIRMNKSEEEKYDMDFPDHPLTQVRKMLSKIKIRNQIWQRT